MVLSQRRVWKRLQRAPLAIPIGLAGKTYRPLRTEILMLCSALQGNKSSTSRGSQLLIQQLERLIEKMKSVEGCPPRSNAELALLRDIVINSDSICTGNGSPSLEKYVFDNELVALDFRSLPCIRQIDKIGRYWGMCKSMAEDSRKYPDLFASIKLNPPLSPYKAPKSLITAGRARSTHLHVHAEMQILAFYGLSSSAEIPKPRVIGVSRAACYLCNLFVQSHGQFFVTKTHGWLFDAWNFPDLAGSDPHQQTRYRHAIARMDVEIQRASAQERWNPSMRQKPMGSRLALPLQSRLSPAPSTDLSTVLEVDEVAMHLPASYPAARRLEETRAETRLPGSRSDLSVTPMSAVSSYTPIPTPGIGKPLGAPSEIPPPSPPTTQPASFRHSSHSSLSRVEPINRTDLPPACTSIPLSLNPPSPSSEPTQPPAASGGKEISTLSSSSSSIVSWELPVTRPVASKSSFRIRSNNVTISFEIEDGARGSVSIEELSTTSDGLITGPPSIDLKAVSEDQILTFGRRDDESSVVLSLKSSNDDAKKITLRWIG